MRGVLHRFPTAEVAVGKSVTLARAPEVPAEVAFIEVKAELQRCLVLVERTQADGAHLRGFLDVWTGERRTPQLLGPVGARVSVLYADVSARDPAEDWAQVCEGGETVELSSHGPLPLIGGPS